MKGNGEAGGLPVVLRVLHRIADLVREHGDELLALQALDNGVPLSFESVYGMSANMVSIAREEIFGPVLSAIPFSDEDEAVRIANDTEYGLAATVWTGDIKRAIRLTKALRAGTVGING